MGTIWIKELTGGLDVRRLPETTPGGVLIRGSDGHITRGGEFEKRAAFVPAYTLPAGTVSLAYTRTGMMVFGHLAPPTMPTGVSYQRLQHPTPAIALVRVLSFDLYDGKVYAVGEFADGSIHHFYDGVRVTDWFDGRARASFRVIGGGVTPATAAAGSFEITGGAAGSGNEITSVQIDGVSLFSGTVAHTGNNASTAEAVAAAINSYVSTPDYTAVATGQTVNITAAATGTAANGKTIVATPAGSATVGNVVNMAGGAAAITSRMTSISINGVPTIANPVSWTTSHAATASAIAAAINSFPSTPEYTATAVGDTVNIVAAAAGTAENGKVVAFGISNGLVLTPATGLALSGGASPAASFTPGAFVKTVGSKVYSVAGSNLHFSGIQAPTRWTTDAIGAGFINMASENSGSEELVAVARYQSLLAVFAPAVVQIWFIDPDPKLNRQSQVLSNTGTESPKSVTQFGDNDIFYLDESGLRSLRARDQSNSASTTDIGVPIDDLIVAKLETLTPDDRQRITGLINPIDKRFWLIIKDEVFVFSFFANAKVSAWTTYNLSVLANDGATSYAFDAEDAVVFNRRVFIRSGNTIYVHGGMDGQVVFDETEAEAWLPYLDANRPTAKKDWEGVDVALTGLWEIKVAMEPTDLAAEEVVSRNYETSFNSGKIAFNHSSSHASLRFRSRGEGRAVLSSIVLHYKGDEDED